MSKEAELVKRRAEMALDDAFEKGNRAASSRWLKRVKLVEERAELVRRVLDGEFDEHLHDLLDFGR